MAWNASELILMRFILPIITNAGLDRIVHNAHQIELAVESLIKRQQLLNYIKEQY